MISKKPIKTGTYGKCLILKGFKRSFVGRRIALQ